MSYKKLKKYLAFSLLLPLLSVYIGNVSVFAVNGSSTPSGATDSERDSSDDESYDDKSYAKYLKFKPIRDIYGYLFQELKWDRRGRTIPYLKNDTRSLREIYDADIIKTQVEKNSMDVEIANRFIYELDLRDIRSTLLVANVDGVDHVAVMVILQDGTEVTEVIVDLSIDMEIRDTTGTLLDLPLCYYPEEYVKKLKEHAGKIRSLYLVDEDVRMSGETFRSCRKIWMHPDTGMVKGNDTLDIPLKVMGEYTIPSNMSSRKSQAFSLLAGYDESTGVLNSNLIPISWRDFEEKYIVKANLDKELENLTYENLEKYRTYVMSHVVAQLRENGFRLDMVDADKFMKKYF